MKVLVAGSTGVIGRQLVPMLVGAGHRVVELVRPGSEPMDEKSAVVETDVFDRTALATGVRKEAPDVVVDMLTAIPAQLNPRRLARDMALTNRLRTEGTANLIAASSDARLVAQGLAYAYRPTGGAPVDEDHPLWDDGPKQLRPVVEALVEHERLTAELGGTVLRFGHLYGPGTMFSPEGSLTAQVRGRKMPIVGDGGAVFSFTHAQDAAAAVLAALDRPYEGALNIVDDEPAPLRDWLSEMARILGAPAPRKAPTAMARMAVGSWGIAYMTRLVGADNRRARSALDWQPGHPSWRDAFAAELGSGKDGGGTGDHYGERS